MTKKVNEILETILQKPESVRKVIAFVSVVFIMTIIIGIWWTTFSIKPTSVATENTNSAVASPFAVTWNSIKNILKLNPIFK